MRRRLRPRARARFVPLLAFLVAAPAAAVGSDAGPDLERYLADPPPRSRGEGKPAWHGWRAGTSWRLSLDGLFGGQLIVGEPLEAGAEAFAAPVTWRRDEETSHAGTLRAHREADGRARLRLHLDADAGHRVRCDGVVGRAARAFGGRATWTKAGDPEWTREGFWLATETTDAARATLLGEERRTVHLHLGGGVEAGFAARHLDWILVELRKTYADREIRRAVRIPVTAERLAGRERPLAIDYPRLGEPIDAFLAYRYRTTFGVRGGDPIEGDWRDADAKALAAVLPFREARLYFEADDAMSEAAESATVEVFYRVGTREFAERKTIGIGPGAAASVELRVAAPREGDPVYEYEVRWRLRDGRTLATGRRPGGADAIVFMDELLEDLTGPRVATPPAGP